MFIQCKGAGINKSDPKKVLETLMRETGLWKASKIDNEYRQTVSSGFDTLDKELPGLGWPQSGVTEVLYDRIGIGELKLMMPAISHLSRSQNRWIALINPPHIPYAPALEHEGVDLTRLLVITQKTPEDYLWALEKSILETPRVFRCTGPSCLGSTSTPSQSGLPCRYHHRIYSHRDSKCSRIR